MDLWRASELILEAVEESAEHNEAGSITGGGVGPPIEKRRREQQRGTSSNW